MATIRILNLTRIYPNNVYNSEGRSVRSLDHALADTGHQVTTLVLRQWVPSWIASRLHSYKHLAIPDSDTQIHGLRVIVSRYLHIPKLPYRFRAYANVQMFKWRAMQIYHALGKEYDLILAQGAWVGIASSQMTQEIGVPNVVILRDDLRHLLSEDIKPIRSMFNHAFGQAGVVILIGPGQLKQSQECLPASALDKIVLAPNGIDVEEITSLVSGISREDKKFNGKIVSVCNLYRYKGVHENLLALKVLLDRKVCNWHYTIVGDGPYRSELEQMANQLGMSNYITFMGRLPHGDAMRVIRNNDIFCLPSWMEAYGQVYAEAAVCGVPAIGCLENGPEVIIRDQDTGFLIPPKDVNALANALEFLLTHPEETQSMGKRAAEHAKSLSWQIAVQVYIKTLEELVHRYAS